MERRDLRGLSRGVHRAGGYAAGPWLRPPFSRPQCITVCDI